MLVRSNDIYSTYEDLKNYDYVGFAASIPGEYDCIAMFYGENYNELFNYIWDVKSRGFDIEFFAPLKYYWNTEFKDQWQEFQQFTFDRAQFSTTQ